MDIENTWKNSGTDDDQLSKILNHKSLANIHSKLPLKKLKNKLIISLVWAIIITIAYAFIIFTVKIWQVQLALIITSIFNFWIIVKSWKLYKETPNVITPDVSLKQELEKHYNSFMKSCKLEQKVGLFVYPVAATGGFILGGNVGSGKTAEEFLYNPLMLIFLGITLIILIPLCYYLTKWMVKITYGKHLKKLKELIDELGEAS